jgi:hypothetical protein
MGVLRLGDRHHAIGVGGVSHPEKESEDQDREDRYHRATALESL